jgi:hypothetical protein
MDMAVEARYSHVPLTAKERGLFLVNAHFLPTTKKTYYYPQLQKRETEKRRW